MPIFATGWRNGECNDGARPRGPRVCIGMSFFAIEATVILAMPVRAFRFKTFDGYRPHPVARATLRPAGGMPLLVTQREPMAAITPTFREAHKAS